MSQKIQTKLNDIAHLCRTHDQQVTPCGYHESRVFCDFYGIEADLLTHTADPFHSFMENSKDSRALAERFCAKQAPAGSWYLVKEQRLWLTQQFSQLFQAHPEGNGPLKLMIAGVASYVHAVGQLLIIADALQKAPVELEIYFADRCQYPLQQIKDLLTAIQDKPFLGYKFTTLGQKVKCPSRLNKVLKQRRDELLGLTIHYVAGDLSDSTLFEPAQFDVITEHFMTSLLYKNFEVIKPIRGNYHHWLTSGGHLFSADGLRLDASIYQDFVALNQEVGLTVDKNSQCAVWDPYGMPQETFQALIEGNATQRYPVEHDNTLSGFVKHG